MTWSHSRSCRTSSTGGCGLISGRGLSCPSIHPSRTQWRKCTFSGDGEFIVAGSHRQHELYIWDKATGSLVKMLTGQKGETLLDIAVRTCKPHVANM